MVRTPLQLLAADWPHSCDNLPAVARTRAKTSPDEVAFTFLDYSAEIAKEQPLTCEVLDRRARQIAAMLQTRERAGARILLLYPAGLDYLCAFFGCLYAGMIAVPAYPPLNPRLRDRLAAVAHDCDATIALTDAQTLQELGDRSTMLAPLARLRWYTTDGSMEGLEYAWRAAPIDRHQLALLQYTSGSSGTPKGVMVTHANLLHNVHAIALQMQIGLGDHVFSWLPPYHDMGLIGSILTPFCTGVPLTFMAPLAFLRRPARWLREISARRCTVSGAPNFAYELCLGKMSDEDIAALDLSRWSLAFTGAEPIKLGTLERFAERFSSCGFDSNALYPCYGMAETTLLVTGKPRNEPFNFSVIDRQAYAQDGRAVLVPQDARDWVETQSIISCGLPGADLRVVVVDPVSLVPLEDDRVGEIAVSGPSIAHGYWKQELETLATFGVQVPGQPGKFMRTGDLGFMHEGELYVSGRLKDTIIIRGVNHYPQDIESTVDQCHEAIRTGCGICLSVDSEGEEHLVVVQEIGRRDKERSHEILQAMRTAILDRHQITPSAIVLVENGSIHKTTSGKLSRRPCREDFLKNQLRVITLWNRPVAVAAEAVAEY
jgi:acyl-CoA synthetase (AMP-forming)/AMP-acid ligase II